jgi:hypothetical protein
VSEEQEIEEGEIIQNVSQIIVEIEDELPGKEMLERINSLFSTIEFMQTGDSACCVCSKEFTEDDDIRMSLCGHFSHFECVVEFVIEKKNEKCPHCERLFG